MELSIQAGQGERHAPSDDPPTLLPAPLEPLSAPAAELERLRAEVEATREFVCALIDVIPPGPCNHEMLVGLIFMVEGRLRAALGEKA